MDQSNLDSFKEWLSRNQAQFESSPELYTLNHIADVAMACGFDRQTVIQWRLSQSFKGGVI